MSKGRSRSPSRSPAAGHNPTPTDGPWHLLAEDNAVNQTVTHRLLEQMGYQGDVVGDGSAVDGRAADPLDVILMDVQMPRDGRLEATRRIRVALAGPTEARSSEPDRGRVHRRPQRLLKSPVTTTSPSRSGPFCRAGRSPHQP